MSINKAVYLEREKGRDAWIKFKDNKKGIYILDPAAKYIGKLEDIKKQKWSYQRPEDEI